MRFMACVVAALLCTTGLSQVDKSNALTLNSLAEVANTEYDYNEAQDLDMVEDIPQLPPPKGLLAPVQAKSKEWTADYVKLDGQRLHVSSTSNSVADLATAIQKVDPRLQKAEAIGIVNQLNFCQPDYLLVGSASGPVGKRGCIQHDGDLVTAWALQINHVPIFDQSKAPKLANRDKYFMVRSGTSVVQLDWIGSEFVQKVKGTIGKLLNRNPETFHVYDANTNRICHPNQPLGSCGIQNKDTLDIQFLDEKFYTKAEKEKFAKDSYIEEDEDDDVDEQELVQVEDEDSTELVDEVDEFDEDENAPVKKIDVKKDVKQTKQPAKKPSKLQPKKKVRKDKLIKKIKPAPKKPAPPKAKQPLKPAPKKPLPPHKTFVEEEEQFEVVDYEQDVDDYDYDDESAYIEQEQEVDDEISPFANPSTKGPKKSIKGPAHGKKGGKGVKSKANGNPQKGHPQAKGKPIHGKPQPHPQPQKLQPKQSKTH